MVVAGLEEYAALGVGALVVWLGLMDAFLTILHPDVDGAMTRVVNRGVWRAATAWARLRPSRRSQILGSAGPAMIIVDLLLWMVVPILGYGIMVWPYLSSSFDAPTVADGLWDAIYFSGVTFTTLGFGDITPLTPEWEVLAIAEALSGFLVMSTSIAYIVAVFEGVDQRDALALRIYSETGGTWEGARFLERALKHEGPDVLRQRIEGWAALARELHGRLYRFHGLAFYLRTQGIRHAPERMLYALAEASLQARILSTAPAFSALQPSSEHLATAFEHLAIAIAGRDGSRKTMRQVMRPEPTPADVEKVRARAEQLRERLGVVFDDDPSADRDLVRLAARKRGFLEHIDAHTRWRRVPEPKGPSA